jgi:signal transduction histidine kinase
MPPAPAAQRGHRRPTRARWHDLAEAKGTYYEVVVEDTPVPPVLGDAADLREVLTNLVFNALDAMPRGGR